MPVLLTMHLLVQPGQMQNPGLFLLGMGMGWLPTLFDLGNHLVYGIIAGAIYKHHIGMWND